MSVTEIKARPSYVTFEVRAEEDRTASIEAGHYVGKDVEYAIITPAGSKDKVERRVDEWLNQLEQQVAEDRLPREWAHAYKSMYKDWKSGKEAPINGVSIADWPAVSPVQVKTLQSLNIRSVEDLAAANEEALGRLGMGGRALKQKAIEWLQSAASVGKTAERVVALEQANADLVARNQALEAQLKELAADVKAHLAVQQKSTKL